MQTDKQPNKQTNKQPEQHGKKDIQKTVNLTAEELYEQILTGGITQRQKKFLIRAFREKGCLINPRPKRWIQKNRGKEPFRPKDLPPLFRHMDNLNCMMASLVSCVTGTRREETSEILKENIDFDECRIRLIVTKKGVPQDVYFPKSLIPLLKKWTHYTRDSKYLLPSHQTAEKPIAVTTLSKELEKATQKSGLLETLYIKENGYKAKKYGFHSFRKFFCSMLINSGTHLETARRLMRHEKVELTARTYTQLGKKNLTSAMDHIDPYAEARPTHQENGDNPCTRTPPNQHPADTNGIFAGQYIQLFNEFRNGRITEEEYRRQRQELTEIQALMKG